MNVYSEILKLSEEGRSAAMATVISKAGSGPGTEGARCLIAGERVVFGSVGGGMVEAEACGTAARVVSSGRPMTLSFNLKGGHAAEAGMLCGGEMTIFLEPAAPVSPSCRPLFEKLKDISSGNLRGVLLTVIDEEKWQPGGPVPKMLIEHTGAATGSLGPCGGIVLAGGLDDLLSANRPEVRYVKDEAGNSISFFIEPIIRRHVLYVFGGGHVSRALASVAGSVDFDVVVMDDRPAYSKAQDFPMASRVLCVPFDNVLDSLNINEASYLVIATRGHMHDMEVLMQALRTDAGYIGMVGSSRKRDEIFRRLVEAGFTEDDFARVHTPVGIDIGAETPAEIAVSITAEIIRARADGPEKRKVI
ncbi:MAG TPA: XdhC/CoxI family protein [Desulfobacteraceae bacterium]|nr:XdhC/CoxI family protein [Desulfobacteraceae bacterium]